MRKMLIAVVATAVFVGLVGTAGASTPAKKKLPVQLSGRVNNKGTKTIKGGAATIEAADYYFKATFLKATAGSTVTLTVENKGQMEHTFTVDAQKIDVSLKPGDTKTVTVKVPSDGKPVIFYCRFHVGSGMQGAIFTQAATSGAPSGGSSSSSSGY